MADVFAKYVGKTRQISMRNGLLVDCDVKDVKRVYGKVRILVSPVAGKGETWIEIE